MVEQTPKMTLTWKTVLLGLLLVPFSLLIFPFLLLIYLGSLLFSIFFVSKKKEEKYTKEDAIRDFHMDPPGWE